MGHRAFEMGGTDSSVRFEAHQVLTCVVHYGHQGRAWVFCDGENDANSDYLHRIKRGE